MLKIIVIIIEILEAFKINYNTEILIMKIIHNNSKIFITFYLSLLLHVEFCIILVTRDKIL